MDVQILWTAVIFDHFVEPVSTKRRNDQAILNQLLLLYIPHTQQYIDALLCVTRKSGFRVMTLRPPE